MYLCNLSHLHGADGRWVWTLFLCLWRHVFRVHFWEGLQEHWDTPHSHTHTADSCSSRVLSLLWCKSFVLVSFSAHQHKKTDTLKGKVRQVQAGFVVAPPRHKCSWGKTNKLDWRLKWYFWQVINAWVSLELCCCKQLQTFSYYEVVMEYYRAPDAELFWAKFEVVFIVYMQKEYSDMHLYLHSSHK